jgi:hypothetical protein
MVPRTPLWCCVRKFSRQDDESNVFPASPSLIKQKKTTNMIKKHTTRPKTSCEDVKGSMPQRPVRVSRGSTLREQGSRGNADMDLFVAKTQERGIRTPTLSGKAIGEEGENIIRSEILSWHHMKQRRELASRF